MMEPRAALVVVLLLAFAGCGSGTRELSLDDQITVDEIELSISRTVLNSSSYGRTLDGIDELIALCRKAPDAINPASDAVDDDVDRTMKQITEDAANHLRPYQPDLAVQLDRVLDDGCK